eukprot:415266_1
MGTYSSNTRFDRCCMQGLHGSGKTTILYWMKLKKKVDTIPTIGFNHEDVTIKKWSLGITDNGGMEKIRPLWKHHYLHIGLFIWVVDSTNQYRHNCYCRRLINGCFRHMHCRLIPQDVVDICLKYYVQETDATFEQRMNHSKQLLHDALSNSDLCQRNDVIVLVYANKQDKLGAYSEEEIIQKMGLRYIKQKWIVQPCCGLTGEGIRKGLLRFEAARASQSMLDFN